MRLQHQDWDVRDVKGRPVKRIGWSFIGFWEDEVLPFFGKKAPRSGMEARNQLTGFETLELRKERFQDAGICHSFVDVHCAAVNQQECTAQGHIRCHPLAVLFESLWNRIHF